MRIHLSCFRKEWPDMGDHEKNNHWRGSVPLPHTHPASQLPTTGDKKGEKLEERKLKKINM
jgi:hypothetical protein